MERFDLIKPDVEYLKKKGYTLFDMHCHTTLSDGVATVEAIIDKTTRLGVWIAITDHDKIANAVKAYNLRANVIPGIEVTSADSSHVLFYFVNAKELSSFYSKMRGKRLSVGKLADIASDYDCIMGYPHPYGYFPTHSRSINYELLGLTHAVEVINGQNTHSQASRANELAQNHNKPIIGGSDAHTLSEVGSVYTLAKADSIKELFKQIRQSKTYVVGAQISYSKRFLEYPLNLVRNIFRRR